MTISQHPFWKGLDPSYLPLLTPGAREVRFAPGELIVREGDEAGRFYLVLRGEVALARGAPAQGGRALQTVGPGDVLGFSWLMPPFRWHWHAWALEETDTVAWSTAELWALAEANSKFGYDLACRLSEALLHRLKDTYSQLSDFYSSQP